MSFLQPLMLFALPLMALPIIIHLINQRRYQTMRWGAMRFLLTANKMSRGYARIRQWLILAARTLAVAGLLIAACRPLASGILGLVGGSRADTTIVVLDRSPSMSQTGDAGPMSKREASQRQVVDTLKKLGSTHWVLIESEQVTPQEIDSIHDLLELPAARKSSTSANLPAMLDAAAKYIENNQTGRTDIWICSDQRANDWQHRSGEWKTLRDKFLAFPQSVRFHVIGYANPAPENVAIELTEVERMSTDSGSELAVSLRLTREQPQPEPKLVPVKIEIGGASSQVQLELVGKEAELKGHRIPIDTELERGWGRVSIAADRNTADNEFYFAFDKPRPRKTVLVLEDVERSTALQLAAEIAPNGQIECETERIEPHQVDSVAWEAVALVLWHAPLPRDGEADLMQEFVDRGGYVVFFPPESPDKSSVSNEGPFGGISWTNWETANDPLRAATWKMDQDLLANSISGMSLPVGEIQTLRYCAPAGELTTLATLNGGIPLLSRLPTDKGGIYFCSTTTLLSDSSLAENGAVLYVAVQRALANGAAVLGSARSATAGSVDSHALVTWQQRAGTEDALSTGFAHQAGVYQDDDVLLAINRESTEDHAAVLSNEQMQGLFDGLDFSLVENQIGNTSPLVQEIWRAFLYAMIVALLAEALLCVPRRVKPQEEKNSIFRERAEREAVVREMQGAA